MPIQNRAPISDFAVAGAWSGAVGSRYTLVADYPDTVVANYLAHGTAAGNIAFGFAPFTIPANAFAISVQVRYYDAEQTNATNNIQARLRVGGTYFQEPTSHNPAGTTYTARNYTWALNPQTTLAWTPADINGTGVNPLQHFGLISTDANPAIRISCIEIQVTYQVGDYVPIAPAYTVIDNTYFYKPKDIAADRIEIEIGDRTQSATFAPHVMLRRFDDEANVGIGLADANVSPIVANNSGVIEWKSASGNARFYQIQPDAQNEDGGVEFEIVLATKPPMNSLTLPVRSKNVTWFYQPPLTAEWSIGGMSGKIASVSETEVRDASNNLLVYRPLNVVGSYAIYYSAPPINAEGGKLYRCGKVGHLLRPKAIDTVGTWVWCSLSYNGTDTLTLTCPQAFLDSAVYPVVIDPTFGYGTSGGSTLGSGNFSSGGFFAATESGNVTSITCSYGLAAGAVGDTVDFGYYNGTATTMTTHVAHGAPTVCNVPAAKAWFTVNVAGAIIAASYWLWQQQNGASGLWYTYYDSATGNLGYSGNNTFDNWPNNQTATFASGLKLSIYATYTAAGGGLIPYPFSRGARGGHLALSGGLQ
jgi:hypothetical protein